MMHSQFVHLHVHTQYSLLDGACLIEPLVAQARQLKMPALAMTDHGNLFGAITFYETCMAQGVKPILGCEVYVAPKSRTERQAGGIREAAYHLVLLAKDEAGYRNLVRLVSLAYLEGFYYRPRIDKDLLRQHAQGLIGLSGCLSSEIPFLAQMGRLQELRQAIDEFRSIFAPGDFYLELQRHQLPQEAKVNETLVTLARELPLPLVATNDVHYLAKDHAKAHDALLCIQTQTTIDDPNRMKFGNDQFYFKRPEEMQELFGDWPEALKSTIEIAEKCNVELTFGHHHLPQFAPPAGKTHEGYLRELVEEGLAQRYGQVAPDVRQRIEHELEVIGQLGFTSYFLVVWDFVRFARERGIPVGPGRGSAAGSVASYALGITSLDPLRYGLIFERFLNPERKSLPDIDIDFCYERRAEVIQYVIQKYSKDNVAQIITFGTMGAKAVIRDVGRAMNMGYAEVDRIAKLVPNDLNITITEALKQEPELRQLAERDSRVKELMETSLVLEGLTRHASTHAAGVVISQQPLIEHVPLFKAGEQVSTGYDMQSLERIGLLKMDLLGLKTLTMIEEAVKIVKRRCGVEVVISAIPLDDPKTFELFSRADTDGVFQLESGGMRDILKRLTPGRFEDLIAVVALYRPGPIGSGMVDEFIKRKHGQLPIRYDHPKLEPILKDTYGTIVFQEQVMQIAADLAGFSMAESDNLRRAMGKKIPEVMEEQHKRFVEGAIARGVSRKIAEKTFGMVEYFAGYGFNKSHSAAYALIAYQTAYLKANYPVEFMTALLTTERDNLEKIAQYIEEAKRMGMEILSPDVNESFAQFTAVGERGIRFGLAAVKHVGQGAIDSIISQRLEKGPFRSFSDCCERVDQRLVNRKVLESLIKCGACDSFGLKRAQMVGALDQVMERASLVQKDRQRGQLSLFDPGSTLPESARPAIPAIAEWPEAQRLAFEKELLGFYISGHPLAKYRALLKAFSLATTASAGGMPDGSAVAVAGVIAKVRYTMTRRTAEKMAILQLEDLEGSMEAIAFPNAYKTCAQAIRADALVLVRGQVGQKEERPKILITTVTPLDEVLESAGCTVKLSVPQDQLDTASFERLRALITQHPGKARVLLRLSTTQQPPVHLSADASLQVKPDEQFLEAVVALIGADGVKCELSR